MKNDRILANAKIVVNALMAEPDPLPLISACAVAGNGWQENLMEPVTRGPKDHGSDGLLQWRLSRLTELKRYPKWNTLETQCQFFKDECQRDYPKLWAQLVNPGKRSLANLTANICDVYERPSVAGRRIDARVRFAETVFEANKPAEVPPILQNAVDSPWSSLAGAASMAYAWMLSHGIDLGLAKPWVVWVAIGLVLIFVVGKKPSPEVAE
jgi:hypothetical protein